jgi:hypothetical protein
MARFAKYKLGFNNKFLKDGHTMLPQDIIADLQRKSFLEKNKDKHESKTKSQTCKNSYVAVPTQDIYNLEKARLELIKILETTKMLNMAIMMSVTNPMWKITHTKYKSTIT